VGVSHFVAYLEIYSEFFLKKKKPVFYSILPMNATSGDISAWYKRISNSVKRISSEV
jgi:hypothetical protein